MTRQVALADRTYERLKRSRHHDESFSEAIERLMDVAAKDPWSFVAAGRSKLDPDEWIRRVEADRDNAMVPA